MENLTIIMNELGISEFYVQVKTKKTFTIIIREDKYRDDLIECLNSFKKDFPHIEFLKPSTKCGYQIAVEGGSIGDKNIDKRATNYITYISAAEVVYKK